jgi:P4 family phage/plasmid primase-like protien
MEENQKKILIKKGHTFYNYLDKFRVNSGEEYTHTSMGNGIKRGLFNITQNDIFYNKYYNAIFNLNEEVSLIEQHSEYCPIIIDIDMKFKFEETTRLYKEDHIKNLITEYMNEIINYFEISKSDKRLKAFIFERELPYQFKGNVRDGIHIIFPFIISKPDVQYIIRENIIKKCPNIFDDLPLKNKYIELVDRAVISKNGWFMYGSTKPNRLPYELTHIYNTNIEDDDLEEYNDLELIKLLSIRKKEGNVKTRISKLEEIKKMTNKTNKSKCSKISRRKLTFTDIEKIKEIISILSKYRANDYMSWIELGWCLHNIDPYCEELLNIWINFSKTSDKYEIGECEKRWDGFKDGNFTIATLYYWGKIDNPEQYTKLQRGNIQFYIEKSINCTNYDIAVVLYQMFRYEFCCASIKNKCWFEYKNHRWNEVDDGISIRKKISTDLVEEYCRLITVYNSKAEIDEELLDAEEKEEYLRKSKVLADIILKLKTTKFKDNIMREVMELFYNRTFYNSLDTNVYLIGFENGIYDLKRQEFRDGRPDDYIGLSTGIDYIEYNEDSEETHEINNFLTQVLPNDKIREYVMVLLSSFLEGHNADEKFNIWTGCGSNGKSKITQLFEMSFGEYCITFPITLITGKRANSNSATPEIAQSKGKRYGIFQEPSENERINIGLMKQLTGNDKIKARPLFKDPIEFIPQFKLLLVCNQMPSVPADDEAVWRRLEVVEYTSKFVDEPNPENEHEFEKDKYLVEKLDKWKEHFMSLLINIFYKKYKLNKGLNVPNEVKKYTKSFQKNCDSFATYFDEISFKTGIKSDIFDLSDTFEEYKTWHTDYYGTGSKQKVFGKKEYLTFLNRYFPKNIIKKQHVNDKEPKFLIGYKRKIKSNNDNDDSDNDF